MATLVARLMGEVNARGSTDSPVAAEGSVELGALGATDEAEILAEIGAAYLARLGSRSHVPFTRSPRDVAVRVPLDHWSGFLLSLVDGATSISDLIDVSSLPEVEALRVLCELRERGLIDVRPGR
jgi:hypothetical protein